MKEVTSMNSLFFSSISALVDFESLSVGSFFLFGDELHMVISTDGSHNAVSLHTGKAIHFGRFARVLPVASINMTIHAEVVIEV